MNKLSSDHRSQVNSPVVDVCRPQRSTLVRQLFANERNNPTPALKFKDLNIATPINIDIKNIQRVKSEEILKQRTERKWKNCEIHRRNQEEFNYLLNLKRKLIEIKKHKDFNDHKNELERIIRETQFLKENIFASVPRNVGPSFRVTKKMREYTRIWSPRKQFYDRNTRIYH